MATLTEGNHTGEFILSEANGDRSREQVTIVSGQNLAVGQVVGKITASGKYKAYDDAAVDGSETAAGVLYADVDASGGDEEGVIIARDAEVSAAKLVWGAADSAAGTTNLESNGIVAR